jgi:hypothetical protein
MADQITEDVKCQLCLLLAADRLGAAGGAGWQARRARTSAHSRAKPAAVEVLRAC